MFATDYYCLVAGLREYALEADTKGFDARQVRLLYGYYDCENLSSLHAGRTAHNPLGLLTREELEEELKSPKRLPEPLARVIRAYADPEGEDAEEVDTVRPFDRTLFGAYYALCEGTGCRFLREWSAFDRTLRNIAAAISASSSMGRRSPVIKLYGLIFSTVSPKKSTRIGFSALTGKISRMSPRRANCPL